MRYTFDLARTFFLAWGTTRFDFNQWPLADNTERKILWDRDGGDDEGSRWVKEILVAHSESDSNLTELLFMSMGPLLRKDRFFLVFSCLPPNRP
jgi:hypothetical protein